MKKLVRVMLLVLLAGLVLAGTVNQAVAKWPTKPIIITIPWPPTNDSSTIISNKMTPYLSKELGVPVKVINKAGGRGIIGTNFVAQSKPDGHTLALSSIGPMLTQPIRGVTPYKIEDFEVISLVWASSFLLAARGDAPYDNLKELAEYAKTHEVKLGHWGLGTVPTLIAMNIAINGGFQWKETAFGDLSALLLTSGDMDVITVSIPYVADYVKTGQVKILAVMSPVRYDFCPEVPTVSEQGFGKDYMVWFGLFAPRGTPKEVRDRIETAWFNAVEQPEVKKAIKNTGVILLNMRSEQAKKQIAAEREYFTKVMTELNLIKKK
ncbi:MAG: tripartite tricarboxylate transporter substrate binding protein [Deltaproteobacteria bacterium]|nr:tripartite tricarboxylate transporter substrate binding protein [Deltaproteobacteria bacterium]